MNYRCYLFVSPIYSAECNPPLIVRYSGIVFSGHTSAKRNIGGPMTRSSLKKKGHFKAVALRYVVCTQRLSLPELPMNCKWSTEIATTIHEFDRQKTMLESNPDKLQVLFKEMVQMCLWWVN